MKLHVKHPQLFENISLYFSTLIRLALNALLIITILALLVGVYKTGHDLLQTIHQPLDEILENILLDVVFILALTEVTITILGYLKDGTVHVRYIVDTILIIMLNEIVSLWFKHPSFQETASICLIVGILALVRISVTRFAPNDKH